MKWLLKVIYFILCKKSVSLAYFDIHKWLLKKNTEVSNCQTYSSNVSLLKIIRWYQCKKKLMPEVSFKTSVLFSYKNKDMKSIYM